MNEVKMIIYEDIPAWYEIGWNDEEIGLILRIHKKFVDSKHIELSQALITKGLKEKLKLLEFQANFNEDIGYGGIFKNTGYVSDFYEYLIKLPKVKILTNKKCPDCKGTGKSDWTDHCLYCNGSGYLTEYKWNDVQPISATFSVLMTWLRYCDVDTGYKKPQLMTVDMVTHTNIHGGSIGGNISRYFKKLLQRISCVNCEASKVTMKAYSQMLGLNEFDKFDFDSRVYVDGRFIICCPGDRCGLHPEHWYSDREAEGFEFGCHNVDNSVQQLTLMSGLAKLCDTVRKLDK